MSLGQGNIVINQKRTGGGGGGITILENGLSVSGGKGVLGQDVGETGDPAALTSIREIPINQQQIILLGSPGGNKSLLSLKADFDEDLYLSIKNENSGASARSLIEIINDQNKTIELGIESSGNQSKRFIKIQDGQLNVGNGITNININTATKVITTNGQSVIEGSDPTLNSLLIKAAALQSASVFELQNNSSNSLFTIQNNGRTFISQFLGIKNTDIAIGNIYEDGYTTIQGNNSKGVKFSDNAGVVPFIFNFSATAPSMTVDASLTINDGGNNYDTRIEGDTDPNLFFTDASTDKVGIGTNTPAEKLHVEGAIKTAVVSGSAGAWKLGTVAAGSVGLDASNYLTVNVDGVDYKLGILVDL